MRLLRALFHSEQETQLLMTNRAKHLCNMQYNSVADTSKQMFFHTGTEFGRSRSIVCINGGPKILGELGPRPLRYGGG